MAGSVTRGSRVVKVFDWLFELPRPKKRLISVAADTVLLSLALWMAFTLRLGEVFLPAETGFWLGWLVTLSSSLLVFVRLGLYRAVIRYMGEHVLFTVLAGTTLSAVILSVVGDVLQAFQLPRSVPVIYWAFATLFVGGTRYLVRYYVHQAASKEKTRVVVYGAGVSGRRLANALQSGPEYSVVAFVDDDPAKQGTVVCGHRVYAPAGLKQLMEDRGAELVLLALGHASRGQRRLVLRYLEQQSIRVMTIPDIDDIMSGRARIEEVRDIDIEDLLGRDPVAPDPALLGQGITGKNVMVTGAGGSIGSELCRQILRLRPRTLVLFELSEYALYAIEKELEAQDEAPQVRIVAVLGSVQHQRRLESVMQAFEIDTVYHAAAYKHVPLVEHNIIEGIRNNVFGTWFAAEAAIRSGVEKFVLISTDKAVRPTNVMGASKRCAELVLQALAQRQHNTKFAMVRFGNVLGSSGSVVPLFREQIRSGGPVTVTHPDIIRYFMTIPEASQLVLQAGAMGGEGEVFVLDMGEPVRIADLAAKMIHLMGLEPRTEANPDGDIEIVYTGLRPGEKLYEELLIGDNPTGTDHPRILKAQEVSLPWPEVERLLKRLDLACHAFDCGMIRQLLLDAPLGYRPANDPVDHIWCINSQREVVEEVGSSESAS
ncbi:nucleoside-diphosphate sugar epimerase/dehydratase [Hahella sp. SMD15-11]|uniref:Nucleoside-diphosphate sugar epimerase/dehydratase n=1 Tax=Thermohahella caldifontis TaxID=3142973 RepID=A0AB39USF8_9GAMM